MVVRLNLSIMLGFMVWRLMHDEELMFVIIFVFEDMIGFGENDWDYNDFVVRLEVSFDYGIEGFE